MVYPPVIMLVDGVTTVKPISKISFLQEVKTMAKMYLVDLLLPNRGAVIATADYRRTLISKGYNHYQAIGSLGGSISGGSITVTSKIARRR